MGARGPKPRPQAERRRRRREATRRTALKYYRKNKSRINADRNAKADRNKEREKRLASHAEHDNARFVTNALGLARPGFLWMGPDGSLHQEFWETAEELIQRLTRKKKKRSK